MSEPTSIGRDRVVPLESVPRPCSGDPELFIVGNERQLVLAFHIGQADAEDYGALAGEDAPFCLVLFPSPSAYAHTKEDVAAHPLAPNGLVGNCVHEVLSSSPIAEPSDDEPAEVSERHFLIAFDDSTFECIAADCVVAGIYGSRDVAAREAFMLCQ
jgi:hypothetical protein